MTRRPRTGAEPAAMAATGGLVIRQRGVRVVTPGARRGAKHRALRKQGRACATTAEYDGHVLTFLIERGDLTEADAMVPTKVDAAITKALREISRHALRCGRCGKCIIGP